MDNYYLRGAYVLPANANGAFLPFGVDLGEAPSVVDVSASSPAITISNVAASSTGISVDFTPMALAGMEVAWAVTKASSLASILGASVVPFEDLDLVSGVGAGDQSIIIRGGTPMRYTLGMLEAQQLGGISDAGVHNMAAGQDTFSVTFPAPYASAPVVSVTPLHLGVPSELIAGTLLGVSASGFTYALASPAPAAASLLWIAHKSL
jgi:hypothetical protein